ncbi:MAG: DUF1704 domain-containing protein [Clostridiales bacterium]|nr:DUF1704 domain-containing protein [Clostridiales bacterium]
MRRPRELGGERIAQIVSRLASESPVRRSLPGWGRVHIDRQLPFLVVYRKPHDRPDPGTARLVVGGGSFLQASGSPAERETVAQLAEAIAALMGDIFDAFLIVEVWAASEGGTPPGDTPEPAYRVMHSGSGALDPTVEELASALRESRIGRRAPDVATQVRRAIAPPGMRPLLDAAALRRARASILGLQVAPVYRAPEGGDLYPALVRQVARRVTVSTDRAAYRFTRTCTTARPVHYHQLGRRAVVKAVFDVDARLAAVGERFDVLLQVTPVDTERAFAEFKRVRFERAPSFHYRPLPVDPGRLKHQLWSVRPERVEDPTLMHLFRRKQIEIDRQITLLADVGRPEFLPGSLQLYGGVEPGLFALAERLLGLLPPGRKRRGPFLSAAEFCGLATAEVLAYRRQTPGFGVMPVVRDDIYAGLLVSKGKLLVGAGARVPVSRADALIQHEIGTHMVTYHNGRAQPFKMLSIGLPGYEGLQEGLAVLGEYLCGGLDRDRMRVLAARVVAVRAMVDGAGFVETFRLLRGHGFTQRASFTIATRVFRGGGLTKDAAYLRGLAGILDHIAEGRDLDRLFLGKVAEDHLPIIDELLLRKVLAPTAILPRYLHRPDVQTRLADAGRGVTVIDLVKGQNLR